MVNSRETLDLTTFVGPAGNAVDWRISDSRVDYAAALAFMEARAAAIAAGPGRDPDARERLL